MHLMSKKLSTVICLMASVTLLAACGPKQGKQGKAKDSSPAKATTVAKTTQQTSQDTPSTTVSTNQTPTSPTQAVPVTVEPVTTSGTFPPEVLGTFSGNSLQAKDVSITFASDGTVTTTANFAWDGVDNIQNSQATISSVTLVAPNTYRIDHFDGDIEAILPGITGLGGVYNGIIQQGFKIENGTFTPVHFMAPTQEEMDYNRAQDFGVTLNRQ